MTAIFKKELKSYFSSVLGYLVVAFILLLVSYIFVSNNLNKNLSDIGVNCLSKSTFMFFIVVPILSMKIMAEERRQKTDQLLYTAPVRITELVLGKYFALLTILAIPMLVVCLYPVVLARYGNVEWGSAYIAIFGFLLLGAAQISIGVFLSSVTENPVLAAVFTFVVLLASHYLTKLVGLIPNSPMITYVVVAVFVAALFVIFYIMTKNYVVPLILGILLEGALGLLYFFRKEMFGSLSSFVGILDCDSHYVDFVRGVLDIKAVLYFLSVTVLFIFLTVQSVQKRRYS